MSLHALPLPVPRRIPLNAVEGLRHGVLDGASVRHRIGQRMLLTMVGVDPDAVVAVGRAFRCAPDAPDRVVDPLECPMRELRLRAATVRLLVVADEIQMHDGQAARDVDLRADGHQLAQSDTNDDAGGDELKLAQERMAAHDAAQGIHDGDEQLERQQRADP